MQRFTLPLMFVLILACVVPQAGADDCMDCGEQRTQRYTSSGAPIWPQQSQALCCDFPCVGDYEVRDEDAGWGCLTCPVDNELVVGSICCSSRDDQGCPSDGGGGGGGGGGFNDGTGCVRDASGACPADCTSCT